MTHLVTARELERLSAYLDGELSSAEAGALEADLDRDPLLRAALDDLRHVSAHMELDDADFRAAQGIRAAVRGRLTRRQRPAATMLRRWWWVPATAATAVLAFAAFRAGGPFAPTTHPLQVQAVAEQYALALNDLGGGQP